MTTDWKFRIYLFVRAVDANQANKNALASIYVNNGSGQSLEQEKRMFDKVYRLSPTGEEPATVFGVNLTAKPAMRDEFIAFVDTLTNPAYVVLANTTLPQYADGEVILVSDNLPPGAVGKVIEWRQALGYLDIEFGLKVITPPDPTAAPEAQPEIVVPAPAPAIEWVGFEPVKELEAIREVEKIGGFIVPESVHEDIMAVVESLEVEREPEPAPAPTVSIFGKQVKVYDPDFKPTAAVLRLVERVRGKA